MGAGTFSVLSRVPNWLMRWATAHSVRLLQSARQQNEVHCLAELCHCLDTSDEGYVFHPPFLVIKGRTPTGGSRLFAAKLSAAEVEAFKRGMPLPNAAGEFVRSLQPRWKRLLRSLVPTRRRVTARELPPPIPFRNPVGP
jgi:hypothetical protein